MSKYVCAPVVIFCLHCVVNLFLREEKTQCSVIKTHHGWQGGEPVQEGQVTRENQDHLQYSAKGVTKKTLPYKSVISYTDNVFLNFLVKQT